MGKYGHRTYFNRWSITNNSMSDRSKNFQRFRLTLELFFMMLGFAFLAIIIYLIINEIFFIQHINEYFSKNIKLGIE